MECTGKPEASNVSPETSGGLLDVTDTLSERSDTAPESAAAMSEGVGITLESSCAPVDFYGNLLEAPDALSEASGASSGVSWEPSEVHARCPLPPLGFVRRRPPYCPNYATQAQDVVVKDLDVNDGLWLNTVKDRCECYQGKSPN
jgi:hypothetical protein